MDGPVVWELRGRVLHVLIDNPPVNAGSQPVRAGVLKAIGEAGASNAEAVVIQGANGNFVAGSDLREFEGPLSPPEWPEVFSAIGNCPIPVVAAIEGAALGGGYELALACDGRIAAPDAVVGLPEVALGIIPGAGGTQRLPRLTGRAEAIRLICGAIRVPANEALAKSMVDRIAEDDLISAACDFALSLPGKRRLDDAAVPKESAEVIEAAARAALAKARESRAVVEAIALITRAGIGSTAEALAEERSVFQALRKSEQSAALRYLFFAERTAARALPRFDKEKRVTRLGVIGAGTMGVGLAVSLLAAGKSVVLIDKDDLALTRASAAVKSGLARLERGGKLKEAPDAALARLVASKEISAVENCEVVIEAVVESFEVKSAVLSDLHARLSPGAMVVSNTSYLDIAELARASGRPDRFLGLHFFAPVPVMTLVEVVPLPETSSHTLTVATQLVRDMGKVAVRAGPCNGFLGNRIYAAYRRECELLVEEGAMPWDVDAELRKQGFRMGPFQVGDLSGLDIGWALRRSRDATRDPRERYFALPDTLYEMGRLGRKSGAGWYAYSTDCPDGQPDPEVERLVRTNARAGIAAPDAETIRQRAMGAILNEAARAFEDGTAAAASDIDVVLVNGYGFARERGGPLWQASRLSSDERTLMIDLVAHANGYGFTRGDVESLIAALT
jgi:3-hydroxyacyl-CoA dehydrogenase